MTKLKDKNQSRKRPRLKVRASERVAGSQSDNSKQAERLIGEITAIIEALARRAKQATTISEIQKARADLSDAVACLRELMPVVNTDAPAPDTAAKREAVQNCLAKVEGQLIEVQGYLGDGDEQSAAIKAKYLREAAQRLEAALNHLTDRIPPGGPTI